MDFKQTGKPLVLSLMVGLMFLLTACPGDTVPSTPPTAADDTYDVVEGQPRTVAAPGVLSNDGGGDLQATLVTDVAAGTLNLDTNGSFTYTPTGAAGTTDQFTYTASNSEGTSEVATVTLNITPPDNGNPPPPPVLTANPDSFNVTPGGTVVITEAQLTGNDTIPTDVDVELEVNDDLMGGGTLEDNDDDTYTYTAPDTTGTATFTYTLSADDAEDSTATVTINIAEEVMPGAGPYNVNFQSEPGTSTPTGTPPAPAPPATYFADYGQPYGPRSGENQGTGQTYGWVTLDANNTATSTPCNIVSNGRYRTNASGAGIDVGGISGPNELLYQTFMHMEGGDAAAINTPSNSFSGVPQNCAWQIAVPNGTYSVTLALGDAARDNNETVRQGTIYQVSVEGTSFPAEPYNLETETDGGGNDGSESLFIETSEVGTGNPLSITVTDGLLTITPTGTNTKIAFVTITEATTPTP